MTNLPSYISHKKVQAAKIMKINSDEHGGVIMFAGFGSVAVSHQYMEKHRPTVGGYYVRYSDGYESWSPAEAFEQGHTRVAINAS